MKAKTAVPSRNFEQKLLRSERSPSSIYNAAVSAFLFAQSEDWWRRRESNPRPKTFNTGIYIHILNFSFRLLKSPPGWMLKRLSCKNVRQSVDRIYGPTILLVDALTELAGMIRQDASL